MPNDSAAALPSEDDANHLDMLAVLVRAQGFTAHVAHPQLGPASLRISDIELYGTANDLPTRANPEPPRPPDPTTILADLRDDYPAWGFVLDERAWTWTAVRGRQELIVRTDPIALRAAVDAGSTHRTGNGRYTR